MDVFTAQNAKVKQPTLLTTIWFERTVSGTKGKNITF